MRVCRQFDFRTEVQEGETNDQLCRRLEYWHNLVVGTPEHASDLALDADVHAASTDMATYRRMRALFDAQDNDINEQYLQQDLLLKIRQVQSERFLGVI